MIRKVFANGFWLLLDKLSKLFVGLIVIAMVAKHLGPKEFGIWNYAIALTTIIGVIEQLGLEKVLIKELIIDPSAKNKIVATALSLRILAGIITALLCLGVVYFTKGTGIYLYCTFILSCNLLLQSFDIFDLYYQSQNAIHKIVIPKVTVFLLFSGVRIVYIFSGMQLIQFVWLSFFELLLTYIIIIARYIDGNSLRLFADTSYKTAVLLLTQTWPVIFTSLAVIVYLKIDQLMLDALSNPVQLGQYVAAARLSELWYAIPSVISTAILPSLVLKKTQQPEQYYQTMEMWLRLSFWLSLIICMLVTLFSGTIIYYLYGSNYNVASTILKVHIWASIPFFLGVVITQYFVIEGRLKLSLYASVTGTIVNVCINFALIPLLGGVGAAIATVCSYSAVFLCMIFLDTTRKGLYFTGQAISPFRVINDLYFFQRALFNK